MAKRDKWSTNKRVKVGGPNTTSAGTATARATGLTGSARMTSALKNYVASNRTPGNAPAPSRAKPSTRPSNWSMYSFKKKPKV